jgi:hypothetical protein
MTLNLYTYHNGNEPLVGYESRLQIPDLLFQNIRNQFGAMANAKKVRTQLNQHQDILAKSPTAALAAAKLYNRVSKLAKLPDVLLWPEGHAVEKVIAQNPNSLCAYLSELSLKDNPKYHSQIIKADLPWLTVYVARFEKELRKQPEFLNQIFKKFSHDPKESVQLAMNMRLDRRILELEPIIYNYTIGEDDWDEWDDILTAYALHPNTPKDDDGVHAAASESPWNFYVSRLEKVKDRVAAVQQYGFRGSSFPLGTAAQLQSLEKRK